MNRSSSTRARLVDAAAGLFAEHGYRGASVRSICNLAAANPGAISYHFGGKRQLYRAVLRQAAEQLARGLPESGPPHQEGDHEPSIEAVLLALLHRMEDHQDATRLLLHDLADGGTFAVEALVPTLRSAYTGLRERFAADGVPSADRTAQLTFLQLAAPLFLLTTAWPVIERTLDLGSLRREDLLSQLLSRHNQWRA